MCKGWFSEILKSSKQARAPAGSRQIISKMRVPMSTNTWLQSSTEDSAHYRQEELTCPACQGAPKEQKAAFALPVLPHFCEPGSYVLLTMEQLNWHWHWNLFCLSKPSKQGILEVMNGGVLKYFQYLVASFTNKWHFVNTEKKIVAPSSTRKLPFQVKNIWHLLVNVSEKLCDRAGTGSHSSFL